MKWHLNLNVPKYPFEIEHHQKIFSIGSCFAENLANWLNERHFNVFSNPNGVLFNPQSILINLNCIITQPKYFDEKYLFFDKGYWKSFLHQTHFFDTNKQALLNKIIEKQIIAHEFLKSAQYLFITFGSAYVYEHLELKEVVANCHKLPPNIFEKKLLNVSSIVEAYKHLFNILQSFNPDIKIILSVSPVKYLAYGAINNNISKSTLLLSVHELCKNCKNVFYFPAYELITDDLRDYRFFKEDLAHPNDTAIKYVMKKFSESMLSPAAIQVSNEIEKIIAAIHHQPINIHSPENKVFAQTMLKHCETLEQKYSHFNLSKEKTYFTQILNTP